MIRATWRHLVYLFWHKFYVLRAGLRLGVPLWQLVIHDWTKFLPAEFTPYTHYFFLAPNADTHAAFKRAFRLHWSRNPHHWEYWTRGNVLREMPKRYALEMLADWEGSGWAKNGKDDSLQWYAANRRRITLHPLTRQFIERELGLGCPACRAVVADNAALISDGDYLNVPSLRTYVQRLHRAGH